TISIAFVAVFFIVEISTRDSVNDTAPLYTNPVFPSQHETVISSPSDIFAAISPHPTMAGTPNSLATIEAWLVLPPLPVTIADAFFKTGSQSGLVRAVTSISPGFSLYDSLGESS